MFFLFCQKDNNIWEFHFWILFNTDGHFVKPCSLNVYFDFLKYDMYIAH